MSWARSEGYPVRPDQRELAQELFDSGLLYLVNAAVLHPHGLAFGVAVDDDGCVTALVLYESDDPDGIWFDEAQTTTGRRKLAAAGLLRGRRR
jgi:hypothetical protein